MGSVSLLLQLAPSLVILLSLDESKWGKRSGKSETRTSSVGVEDPPIVSQLVVGRTWKGTDGRPVIAITD